MENTDLIKKRTLENDPQYFGAYLNMARHNVFVIGNHLAIRFNGQKKDNEEHISDSFIARKLTQKPNHVFSHLTRFLPIAKVFDTEQLPKTEKDELSEEKNIGKDFTELSEKLKLCFSELNSFRNDYSHYYSLENETNRKINISEKLSQFIDENYTRAIGYSKQRFKGVFEDRHFKLASEIKLVDENRITRRGLVFFTCLFLDRENAFQFINKIIGFKGTHTLDFKATREVFSAFCVRLPHSRFISDDPKQAFVLDMLNELNHCPAILFDALNKNDKRYFLPQITTHEKLKNIEENSIPKDLPEEDYETYRESITKQIRYKSRFDYFALKYLDSTDLTKKILFHINLGKYQIDKYEKEFSGQKEDRPIIENVKGFGRLEDFNNPEQNENIDIDKIREEAENFCNNKIKGKINSETSEFEQFAPHYSIEQNKIAFFVYRGGRDNIKFPALKKSNKPDNKSRFRLKRAKPNGFISVHELKKIVLLEILEKGKAETLISDFLELNNNKIFDINFIENIKNELVFDNDFKRKFRGKSVSAYSDNKLKELTRRKSELNNVLKEYNLNVKQIPNRIVDYCLDIVSVKEESEIANKIKAMKKDCTDRLKTKNKGKAPKIGKMATFLARDIVNMVIDEDIKEKITSFYYDKMQESLALYIDNEKQKTFNDICNELNLFNKEKGHPFLADLQTNNIKNTYDFYEKYLLKKGAGKKHEWKKGRRGKYKAETDISWMYKTFYKKEKVWNDVKGKYEYPTKVTLPENLSKIPLSIRNFDKEKSEFKDWLKNRKEQAIDLPTNIFDNALVTALRKKLDEKNTPYKQTDKYHFLLKLWFGENNLQPFYDYEREYTVYDKKINFKLGTKPTIKDYFTNEIAKVRNSENKERRKSGKAQLQENQVLAVFNNAITKNEKAIRFTHETDRILLLMIKELINSDKNWDIKLTTIKEALSEIIEIRQEITGKLSFEPKKDQEISKTITDKQKRKNFSVLRKLVSDRRLPELFEYYDTDEIPYSKIKVELSSYNKVKELIFDRAFELEKTLIEIAKNNIISLKKGSSKNLQHEPYLQWLLDKNVITENEFRFLKVVRDTFSHNQFPPKETIKHFVNIDNEKLLSVQIYEIYNRKNQDLLNKINEL